MTENESPGWIILLVLIICIYKLVKNYQDRNE